MALWLAASTLLLAMALSDPADASRAMPATQASLMSELSERLRLLETGLASGDLESVVVVASEVRELAARLPELGTHVDAALKDLFDGHAARLGEVAGEVAELATVGRLDGAGQAFEALRAACVECHLRLRSGNAERGSYPARENTITGTVELRDADGELRADRSWILVFLEGPPRTPGWVDARKSPRISQRERRFDPRVLPVIVGAEVQFPNDDTIFHNVFSLSKTAPFDLGAYEAGQSASVRMERPGLVKVYCNIHPEMSASIVVLENPWFALTDRTGHFVICNVPDGEYVLRAWNEMGAEWRGPLQVAGNGVHEARVELSETRRSVSHTNKYGKPYPSKYR